MNTNDPSVEVQRVLMECGGVTSQRLDALVDVLTRIAVALEQRPAAAPAGRSATAIPTPDRSTWPTTFPNYGKSKGAPIAGASAGDLAYYATGAARSLSDPAKSRFHAKEAALKAAIEHEMVHPTTSAPQDPRDEQVPAGGGDAQDGGPDSSDLPFAFRETRLDHP